MTQPRDRSFALIWASGVRPVADRHVRFVFSNEPVERLAGLGERVKRALARG